MKATASTLIDAQASEPRLDSGAVQVTPQQVADAGTRFVPQTLRYLGVAEFSLLDAAQDVFLVALRRLEDFEGRSSLTTWLYGICVRVAHGYRRKKKASRETLVDALPEIQTLPSQETHIECREWQRALMTLLDQLDEAQREVFVLYEIQRLPMKEVSEAVGCPLQTAYFRHKAARTRILQAFEHRAATEEA